jgi:hypothetical protein
MASTQDELKKLNESISELVQTIGDFLKKEKADKDQQKKAQPEPFDQKELAYVVAAVNQHWCSNMVMNAGRWCSDPIKELVAEASRSAPSAMKGQANAPAAEQTQYRTLLTQMSSKISNKLSSESTSIKDAAHDLFREDSQYKPLKQLTSSKKDSLKKMRKDFTSFQKGNVQGYME